jgi:hypothetical protein
MTRLARDARSAAAAMKRFTLVRLVAKAPGRTAKAKESAQGQGFSKGSESQRVKGWSAVSQVYYYRARNRIRKCGNSPDFLVSLQLEVQLHTNTHTN